MKTTATMPTIMNTTQITTTTGIMTMVIVSLPVVAVDLEEVVVVIDVAVPVMLSEVEVNTFNEGETVVMVTGGLLVA